MKNIFIKAVIVILALVIITPSCKKKDEPAPDIPPMSTFKMEFNDFSDSDDTLSRDTLQYTHWGHAFVNAAVWNVIITVGMAVPVASFAEAFNHEAEYHANDEYWTWEYNFNAGVQHTAELKGYLEGDTVIWEMRIDNFLWYYGHSHTNKSGGYWILNESKTQQTKLLKITWERNSQGTTFIKYKNVAPASSDNHYKNNGEYITYGTESSGEFDRFYDIFLIDDNNTSESNLLEIEWNFSDKHGRVKDENRFGDTEWHCWDTNLANTSCN